MFKTLKTLVLKTVQVTSVKLTTPADRIGRGLGGAAYSTDTLSPGQNPLPPNPESERVRSWQESAMQMRMQMQTGDMAMTPASSVGCPSAPGLSANRFATWAFCFTGRGTATTRTTATGYACVANLHAVPGRANFPRGLSQDDRFGCDCQSLRRLSDKRDAVKEVCSAAIAAK